MQLGSSLLANTLRSTERDLQKAAQRRDFDMVARLLFKMKNTREALAAAVPVQVRALHVCQLIELLSTFRIACHSTTTVLCTQTALSQVILLRSAVLFSRCHQVSCVVSLSLDPRAGVAHN